MESIECLNEYERLICSDLEIKNAYTDTLGWIQASRVAWTDDKIRVGVVGVTSSGKSTMINAILGMDILSSAVVPSSGQLVCCAYGEERAAVIHFLNGTQKVLKGKEFCKKNLMKYSDERENPQNILEVMSIELQTPDFELGEDVLLIDSPGLDAYGLEAHEKITLETLVPTIDICMYVTTTKTNSDANALEVLNTVARYNCPIVIVQNKLDAVNGSPDHKKTKEQVALEHYERLRRIVDKSSVTEKDSVEIIQISSIFAKEWRVASSEGRKPNINKTRYNESNFPYFMKKVRERIDSYRPQIESSRMENLYGSVHEQSLEISSRINSIGNLGPNTKRFDYDKRLKEITMFIESNQRESLHIADSIEKRFDDFHDSMKRNVNENNVEYYAAETNRLINKCGDEICEFIKNTNTQIYKFGSYVHFAGRDLMNIPQVRDFQKVEVTTYEAETMVRKKEAGIGGFFKRFTGLFSKDKDKGYEFVTETVTKKDVVATQNSISNLLHLEIIRYKKMLSAWSYDSSLICKKIRDTISEEQEAYLQRQKAQIEESRLRKYYEGISALEKRVKNGIIGKEHWTAEKKQISESVQTVPMGDISNYIFDLSANAKKLQNIEVMKGLVEKENLQDSVPILLGWDENCTNDFTWNVGIEDLKIIHLDKEEPPKEKDGVNTCFFVLVNASQIGSEQKKVKNLRLAEIVEPNDFVVWVIQDFDELLNSYGVDEALRNMLWLREFSEIESKSIIWISHSNPVYNLAFLEHQYSPKESISEQQKYISYLRNNFSVYCDEITIQIIAREMMKVRA